MFSHDGKMVNLGGIAEGCVFSSHDLWDERALFVFSPKHHGGATNFKFAVTDEAIRVIPKTKIRNKTFGGRMIC